MKRLIVNIILLSAILFAINYIIHAHYLPFSWGDKELYTKLNYYQNHKDDYTALFVGGSLIYRHVDPQITDSIGHIHGLEFHSFNAGGDGISFLKQIRIVEDILKNPSPNLEFLYVTLASTSRFRYKNLHSKKFTTWHRPIDMWRAVKVSMEMDLPIKDRLKTSWYYIISAVENSLNIGLLNDALQYLNYPNETYDNTCLGENKNGFFPYDLQELIQYPKGSREFRLQEAMILSHKTYEAQIGRRDSITEKITREFQTYDKDKVIKTLLRNYIRLIKEAEKKGIKLTVIMPPKTREHYNLIIPIYDRLPATNKINLANPIEYPEFYDPKYCYNFHHLNLAGSKIFSRTLAHKILQLEGIEVETNEFVNQNSEK